MAPELKSLPEFKVVGIEIRTSNAAEMNAASAKIPGLWGRFYQEKIPTTIAQAKTDACVVGVYSKYVSDHNGPYSLLAGVEVLTLDAIPNGMTGITIPAGSYLIFIAQGSMPQTLIQTWGSIWKYFSQEQKYQRAYTYDFELYRSPDRVDIHIAVK